MEIYYYLYKITNLINRKIYVGVHKTTNINDDYMGSGKLLKAAIIKYGIENFNKEILDTFDNPIDMFDAEAKLVNEDFISMNETYNIKLGGEGGWDYINSNFSSDQKIIAAKASRISYRDKLKNAEYAKSISIKHRNSTKNAWKNGKYINANIGYGFEGKHHTDEAKCKISKAISKVQRGKGNSMYGMMWIYNEDLKESKRIPKDDPIPEGWLKGRKQKFN